MNQNALLSDAISKSSSLLGGFLSQINNVLGGGAAQQGLFSSLLAQGNNLQTVLAAQTAAVQGQVQKQPQVQSSTQAPAPSSQASDTALTASPIASSPNPAPVDNSSQPSSVGATAENGNVSPDAVLQQLVSLSATLHKIMQFLHQRSDVNHKQAGTSTSPTKDAADAATQTTDTTSTDTLTQDVGAIVAELLAMIQLVIHQLEQTKNAGNSDVKQGDASLAALTDLAAAIEKNIGAAGSAANNQLVADGAQIRDTKNTVPATTFDSTGLAAPDATNLSAEAAGASDKFSVAIASALTSTQDALVADPLLDILQQLEKNIQKLLADSLGSKKIAVSDTTKSAVTTGDAAPADLAAQIAALDTSLKTSIVALQQQEQTIPAPVRVLTATAVQAEAATTTNLLAAIKPQPVADATPPVKGAEKTQTGFTAASTTRDTENTAAPASIIGALSSNTNNGGASGGNQDSNPQSFADSKPAAVFSSDNNSGLTPIGVAASGTYGFASTLSALRATNGGAIGLPTVIDQVVLQLNRSVKSGNDQLSLQLHPADLGRITVRLDFGSDGRVQGVVTADNSKTLDMLQKDSRSLERALQDAGLRADSGSLQFNLNGQGQNGGHNTGQTGQGNGNPANGTQTASGIVGDTAGDGLVDIGAIAETYYITPNGVNIQV